MAIQLQTGRTDNCVVLMSKIIVIQLIFVNKTKTRNLINIWRLNDCQSGWW